MNTNIANSPVTNLDLAHQAPHSPRARIAGFCIAARTADKSRATTAGSAGEFHFDCPLDNLLFSFKGITADQFKTAAQGAGNYADLGVWLLAHGQAKTPAEITAWSDQMEAFNPSQDPAKAAYFIGNCKKLGLKPEATTMFDMLEADDRATFSGRPVR